MKKELIELLTLTHHEDVISYIKEGVNTSLYIEISGEDFTVFVPRDINYPVCALTAHTDTVFKKVLTPQEIGIKGHTMFSKHKSFGLGVDDRAGCYIIMKAMQQYPKDFIFCLFDGEESGCIGSTAFNGKAISPLVKLWVGFDRRGRKDVVNYGYENAEITQFISDNYFDGYSLVSGSVSDVSVLAGETGIACLNFSTGFSNEHTSKETLNLKAVKKIFTNNILQRLISLGDKQYKATKKFSRYGRGNYRNGYGYGYGYGYDYDDYDSLWGKSKKTSKYFNENTDKNLHQKLILDPDGYSECYYCLAYDLNSAMTAVGGELYCPDCVDNTYIDGVEEDTEEYTICPFCGKELYVNFNRCSYCSASQSEIVGYFLEEEEEKLLKEKDINGKSSFVCSLCKGTFPINELIIYDDMFFCENCDENHYEEIYSKSADKDKSKIERSTSTTKIKKNI